MTTTPTLYTDISGLIYEALAAETAGNLEERNKIATRIHKHRIVRFADGSYVETLWDKWSQNWITLTCDDEDYQVEDADYTGNKLDAAVTHLWALHSRIKHLEL